MTRRRKPTALEQAARYRKALSALLLAIGTWGVTAVIDGIDSAEWFGLLVAVATGIGVAATPKNAEPGEAGDEDGEGGYTLLEVIGAAVIFAIVVWVLFALLGDVRTD